MILREIIASSSQSERPERYCTMRSRQPPTITLTTKAREASTLLTFMSHSRKPTPPSASRSPVPLIMRWEITGQLLRLPENLDSILRALR